MTELQIPPIDEVKALVDQLHSLGISPLHLHVDTRVMLDQRPRVNVWLATRTDFETFTEVLGVAAVERPARAPGQREWFAEADTPARALLVQAVSFVHHADWLPRPEAVTAP